jgi:hypothetical protein
MYRPTFARVKRYLGYLLVRHPSLIREMEEVFG